LRSLCFSEGRGPSYRGWGVLRLSGRAGLVAAACCALLGGGCSIPLGSLFNKHDAAETEVTGTVNPAANAMAAMQLEIPNLPEADLAYARAAASEVMASGSKGVSQTWENPATGARGAVTPLTSAYTDNGNTCREFLMSHVQGKVENWLEGDACKFAGGKWEVRSLKAWRRS
jgi:surface antigen